MASKQKLILLLLSTLTFNQAVAKSDVKNTEGIQTKTEKHENHLKHQNKTSKNKTYHGVFLGFLPCKDCEGIKTTLSLKNKNNYLLVTQPSKASAREYFEKGKYNWDEEAQIVTLTSRKNATIRNYKIKDNTLVQISSNGTPLTTTQKNTSYILRKSKKEAQKTTMHGH